jgi:hypothetical protein
MPCATAVESLSGSAVPAPDSLRWALVCPAIRSARGHAPSSRLTCPVRPEMPYHYGCVDGVLRSDAERYDSFNGAGAYQHCITHGLMP